MKKPSKKISPEELQEQSLLEDIIKTKSALDAAYSNFSNVVDPDLIDCYIYEMNSVQKRYKFLLERAKQRNVNCFVEDP